MNLTQRREGARTQRAVANDSLRPSAFAALRNSYAVFEALAKTGTASRKKCQPLRERSVHCRSGNTSFLTNNS